MIDLNTNAAKQRFRATIEKISNGLEVSFSRAVIIGLNRSFTSAANLAATGNFNIATAIEKNSSYIKSTVEKNLKKNAETFGFLAFGEIFKKGKKSIETEFDEPIAAKFWATMNRWIKFEATKQIKNINRTTRNTIKNIIKRNILAGNSNAQIAKEIRSTGKIVSKSRAKTIARTETHNGAGKSIRTAVESSGIKLKYHEWISANDSRTRVKRFNHLSANGETVKIDDPFINTGEEMAYPGDSAGSAGNVINCRCQEIFYTRTPQKAA